MRASRVFILLVLAATLGTLLGPRRDAASGEWRLPGQEAITGRKTILFTVWGAPFEDRLFLDRYARRWEQLNPGVDVAYRRYGDDILMKYNAWHLRRRGAEVMRLRVTDYHGMAARGLLERLDPYLADPEQGLSEAALARIPPHLRELLAVDGPQGRGIYALPQDNAQYGLYYNRAIFDAHNAEHPDDPVEYPSADWTWADLRDAARRLARRAPDGRLTQRGIDFAIWSWPFMTFFAQAGGRLWSEDGLTCLVDSPAGVEALEFMRAMQREDRSFQPTLSGYATGSVGPDALFAAGRTAMLLDGSWRAPNLDLVAPDLDYAIAPLPRGRVPAVVSGAVLWGISSQARHKLEGWRFLRWLIDTPQALEYWDTLRVAPPANLEALGSPAFRETHGVPRLGPDGEPVGWEVRPMPAREFPDKAAWLLHATTPHPDTGRPPGFVPVGPYQTALEEELARMLNAYLRDDSRLEAREALERVVRQVHSLIDRDRAANGLPPVARP